MKILVVEDDPFVSKDLKDKLESLGFKVTAIAESYETALNAIEVELPDLALLDIELKGTHSGIDLGKKLVQLGIPHMYLTGVQDSVTYMRTRETAPLRNIPKPVTAIDLRNALDIDLINPPSKAPTIIRMIADGDKKRSKINPNDIIYIEADGSYCHIFLENDKLTLAMNLKTFLQKLDWPDIIRTGRSFAVNIHRVNTKMGNRIETETGTWIDIEPQYKLAFEKHLKNI